MTDTALAQKYPLHCDRCVSLGPYTYDDTWYDLALHKDEYRSAPPNKYDYVIGNVRGAARISQKLSRLYPQEGVHPVTLEALKRAHIKGLLPTNIEMFWKDA